VQSTLLTLYQPRIYPEKAKNQVISTVKGQYFLGIRPVFAGFMNFDKKLAA
jgi:hypothetical protein